MVKILIQGNKKKKNGERVTRMTLIAGQVESLGDRHRAFKVEPVSEGDNIVVSLRKHSTFTSARTRETLACACAMCPCTMHVKNQSKCVKKRFYATSCFKFVPCIAIFLYWRSILFYLVVKRNRANRNIN